MSGLLKQIGKDLFIKDGENYIPIHPNSYIQCKLGCIYEFVYITIEGIKYAELKQKL